MSSWCCAKRQQLLDYFDTEENLEMRWFSEVSFVWFLWEIVDVYLQWEVCFHVCVFRFDRVIIQRRSTISTQIHLTQCLCLMCLPHHLPFSSFNVYYKPHPVVPYAVWNSALNSRGAQWIVPSPLTLVMLILGFNTAYCISSRPSMPSKKKTVIIIQFMKLSINYPLLMRHWWQWPLTFESNTVSHSSHLETVRTRLQHTVIVTVAAKCHNSPLFSWTILQQQNRVRRGMCLLNERCFTQVAGTVDQFTTHSQTWLEHHNYCVNMYFSSASVHQCSRFRPSFPLPARSRLVHTVRAALEFSPTWQAWQGCNDT